jgi:hypothetical protein
MAVRAFFTQPAKVRVIFFVAIDTTGGRFTILFTGSMAVAAFDGTMFALEYKVSGLVVEGFQVQLYDVCGSSFVIGMAMLALHPFHLGIAAMKPFFLFEVNTHRLVACQALLILPAFFEQGVTLGAFRFIFGVTLDHGPRHQKLFIRIGICFQRQQHNYSY